MAPILNVESSTVNASNARCAQGATLLNFHRRSRKGTCYCVFDSCVNVVAGQITVLNPSGTGDFSGFRKVPIRLMGEPVFPRWARPTVLGRRQYRGNAEYMLQTGTGPG